MGWKRLVGIALIAFAIYFVVRSPVESATAIKDVSSGVQTAARSLATSLTTFLQTLF
jgi:hypothetical protein